MMGEILLCSIVLSAQALISVYVMIQLFVLVNEAIFISRMNAYCFVGSHVFVRTFCDSHTTAYPSIIVRIYDPDTLFHLIELTHLISVNL